jgi:hypothetical protein
MDFLRIAGQSSADLHRSLLLGDSTRLATSDLSSCMNSIDCFGRALAVDTAYRHLTSAEQYLLDAQKMQDTAPHTNVTDKALNYIDRAKEFLRPYSVSEDNASCREPPVCITKKSVELDPVVVATLPLGRKDNSKFI